MTKFNRLFVLLLAGIVMFSAGQLFAQARNCDFWGIATYEGRNVNNTDVIKAYDPNGIECGTAWYCADGQYAIHVKGDDPNTAGVDEGAADGDAVVLKINTKIITIVSGNTTWSNNGSIRCDINVPVSTCTMTISGNTIPVLVPGIGGSYQFIVTLTGNSCTSWEVASKPAWVSLDKSTGNTGATTVSVNVAGNAASSTRSGNITVQLTGNAASAQNISINQDQAPQGPPLWIDAPLTISVGSTFDALVKIGTEANPAVNLKLVTFELYFTHPEIVDELTFTVGGFFTEVGLSNVVVEKSLGKISASLYRLGGSSSGQGLLLDLKYKVSASAVNGTKIEFTFGQIQGINSSNAMLVMQPAAAKYTVTVSTDLTVWPGDANNNGEVEITDINPIIAGYWNATGPARSGATPTWTAQVAARWTPKEATYADCDGSGAINIYDVNPIVLNFGKTHGIGLAASLPSEQSKPLAKTEIVDYPPAIILAQSNAHVDEEFWVDIQVGSSDKPVSNLKIMSFILTYSHTEMLDFVGYRVGGLLSGAQATVIGVDSTGKVNAAVYTTSAAQSGYGVLIELRFKVLKSATDSTLIHFDFSKILSNAGDNSIITMTPESKNVLIKIDTGLKSYSSVPVDFNLEQNYPNPFNPSTNIHYGLPMSGHVSLDIYNSMGQKIATLVDEKMQKGSYDVSWKPATGSGVYFYRLVVTPADGSQPFMESKKMIFAK